MESLRAQIVSGVTWASLDKFLNQGLEFGLGILLARLVDPSEFGLVAIATIFISISKTLADGGFGSALIQRKELTRLDISTVFFTCVSFSAFLGLLILGFAPSASRFFAEPDLTPVLRLLSATLLISSLGVTQRTVLARNMHFKKLFWTTFPSAVLTGVIGIFLAFLGYGVWALVYSRIVGATVETVGYWWWSDESFSPRFEFSRSSLSKLWSFGSGVLASSLLYSVVQNSYGILIGKYFSVAELAYFNRARSLQRKPTAAITSALLKVLFPLFSIHQDDSNKTKAMMRRAIGAIAFMVFPMMTLLSYNASPIVQVLLTEKWLPSVPYLYFFPVVGAIYPIAAVQLLVIRASGRSGKLFAMDLLKVAAGLLTLFFTLSHGVLAVVLGRVGVAILTTSLINMPACHYLLSYKITDQIRDLSPYILASLVSILPCVALEHCTQASMVATLCVSTTLFSVCYIGICCTARLQGYVDGTVEIKKLINRIRTPVHQT